MNYYMNLLISNSLFGELIVKQKLLYSLTMLLIIMMSACGGGSSGSNRDDNVVIEGESEEGNSEEGNTEEGEGETEQGNGSRTSPFIVSTDQTFTDVRDTLNATDSVIDSYPPNTLDESGPEYYYQIELTKWTIISASIAYPEPVGTDIDLHLVHSIDADNPGLIERGHYDVRAALPPGTYYLVMDTYVEDGIPRPGEYNLSIEFSQINQPACVEGESCYFNEYILMAVEYLYTNYGLLGYSINSALTHDIEYGDYGTIYQIGDDEKTMCVAAALEVMLTAMQIYADETGDITVYDFLPISSWQRLGENDFRGHVWVSHEYNSYGSADALRNFGMGEIVPFESLLPGSFININRTTGSGHAVVFIAFIDVDGNEYETYPDDATIIGFKYFSSQGGYDYGEGGLDYRYAIFSDFHTEDFCQQYPLSCDDSNIPIMPYKRDINIIYSLNQHYLNTGMMFHPVTWETSSTTNPQNFVIPQAYDNIISDPKLFDGWTIDD